MMEGAGFTVIDIGINNPVESYFEALEEQARNPRHVGAFTTTMPYMKVVIDALVEKGIVTSVVLVGGAPLNEAFAESIGADAYCRRGRAAETAKQASQQTQPTGRCARA